jgi:exopolyphosphatase / guanosine-5'-triphosphate,3'-diphosphate pyrophosphatase
MLLATVDIGSNAVRLLFANVFERKNIAYADKASLIRIPVRLGMDVFEKGLISEQRAEYLYKTLQAFQLLIDVYQPAAVDACATAAMREARNGQEVLNSVIARTGMKVRTIDGLEEAEIISAANNSIVNRRYRKTLYIDVGGGSTEISLFDESHFIRSNSFKIGTIRLLFGQTDAAEWKSMDHWLRELNIDKEPFNCIGSGGNINKLTKLFGDTQTNTLGFEELNKAIRKLEAMSLDERMKRYGLRPDRADVIVPAGQIFISIMKATACTEILAPKMGLADGLAIQLFKKLKSQKG